MLNTLMLYFQQAFFVCILRLIVGIKHDFWKNYFSNHQSLTISKYVCFWLWKHWKTGKSWKTLIPVSMTEHVEQLYCTKFCQKLGDTQAETIHKIQQAFSKDAPRVTQIKGSFNRFIDGKMTEFRLTKSAI